MEWQVFRSCLFKIWFTQLCLKSPNVTVCLLPQSKRTCSRVFFSFWFSGFSFWFAVFSFWFSVSDSRSFVSDSRILVSDSRDIWFLIRGILVSDSRILVSDSRLLVSDSLFLIRGKFLIRGLFISNRSAWIQRNLYRKGETKERMYRVQHIVAKISTVCARAMSNVTVKPLCHCQLRYHQISPATITDDVQLPFLRVLQRNRAGPYLRSKWSKHQAGPYLWHLWMESIL